MYNAEKFYLKIINSIYLNLSRTASSIPFGGNYFLDEVTRGVGELILKEYEEQFNPESTKPSEICKAYLKTLGRQDFLEDGAFQLEDDGDSVVVTMNPKDQEHCIYKEFCREAQKESLLFYCPRLGVLQSVLKKSLGVEYSTSVDWEPESKICRGRISPVKRRLRTEMARFVDDTLNIAGERAMLFTKDAYLSLLTAVAEYAPFILRKVLFDSGYRSFLGVAREAQGCYKSPEKSLSVCFEEMKNCGIGMIELVSLDSSAGHAVIRCYQSFEVAAVQGIELY
ncbi:MAG: hypothetical protein PHH05_09975, partial [Syntrophaceticus sp.]|nr:hypothetical protein [Syntrophaceticus sp.]